MSKLIRQTVTFKATPHEVYEALMDSRKHAKFTGDQANISRKVGGKISAYGDYIDIERWRRGKADMEALMAQCLVEQVIMRGLSEESLAEMDRLVTGLYVQRVISPEGETHYSSLYPLHNDEVIAGLSAAPAGTAAH